MRRLELARHRVVRRARVVLLQVRLGEWEALSLLRDHMHDTRALERLHELEGLHHLLDVVPIDRPEVAEPELLEQHPPRPQGLDPPLDRPGERYDLPPPPHRPRRS